MDLLHIGSKRGKLQACPHRPVRTLFPEGGMVWKIPYCDDIILSHADVYVVGRLFQI